ncbi:MAG TPA: zinc ribbon domain-containing protein, partial [Verrucomicrobiae bacterium]|nr:zinc ribbon domain-containing protein [Verrucomicrobiae bacterium]
SRLMSRFATLKSEDDRMEAAADPSHYGDLDENDPRSVAKYVKRMGEEMGEDLGPDLDAAMDEAMDDEGPGGETSLSEAGSGDEG